MELVAQYEREYLVSKQWLLWDLRDVANLDHKREQTARGQSTTAFHGYSVPNSDTHHIPNGYTYSIPNAHSYSLPRPPPPQADRVEGGTRAGTNCQPFRLGESYDGHPKSRPSSPDA